jgi:PAS domain S-box-containing protein
MSEYQYPAQFKAAIALSAIEGSRTLVEIALRYGVTVEQVKQWKSQLLDKAADAFAGETEPSSIDREISNNELALTIAQNSTQGFAMMDQRGYCIYANRAWLHMTGYSAAEIGSQPLHDLVHHHYPDGRPYPLIECPIDRALPENFEVRAHEDLFFRKDGSTFPVVCAASPIFKGGQPVATVIEIRDITEKKRVDEELNKVTRRQSFQLQMAEQLRILAEPSEITDTASRLLGQHFQVGRVGYGEVDADSTTVSVRRDWTNGVMSSLSGESRPLDSFGPAVIAELRNGRTLQLDDIATDQRSASYAAGYASIGVRSMIVVPLLEAQRLTGVLYLHEPSPRSWTEDEMILAEDVARRTWEAVKRARAEEHLLDETRVLELLNQTGQIVASTLDMQTLLQSITDTATQLSGAQFGAYFYNMTDVNGKAYMLYTLSGAPREAFERFGHPRATPLFGATFNGGPIVRSNDVTKDARYGHFPPHHGMPPEHLPVRSYLAAPVISRSGDVLGGLFFGHSSAGIFTERTERLIAGVAAQAAVAIDNARLYEEAQHAATEREELLSRERIARAEAERLSRMKDEFLAMLAHELRNPLAPISSAAELLNLMYAGEPRVHKSSEIIKRQVGHMTRLVDDLLDVSRVTRDLVRLDKRIIDFRQIIGTAMNQVQELVDAKRHDVELCLPDEPIHVAGDETRLVQVVTNILNNAAKYTQAGGRIEVKLEAVAERLQLHIMDNGSGIPSDLLPDIFGLFTQGARTLARSQGGLGLGLALVKKMVELHGGSVAAHSAGSGQGSEFIVSIPLVSLGQASPDGNISSDEATIADWKEADSPKLKLVVVDDNVDAADTLAGMLQAHGHTVSVYYTAEEALRNTTGSASDAYLVDIGLPGMDGYELARQLRARPETADIQLIAISGYGQAQDRQVALTAGFNQHLVKPALFVDLIAMLTERKAG